MAQARLVIAGVKSGVGKTTVATGLMAALRQRGLRVQGCKVGPDYIDSGYHTAATGRPARNLDSFLLPEAAVREVYLRAAGSADIVVIEGVMGLYDGKAGSGAGSTAEVARLLKAPVLLIVDATSLGQSAAAMVLGYIRYDPAVRIVGVVLNRVAGERHRRILQEAIEAATGLPVIGCLGREEQVTLPSRQLGLMPTWELAELPEVMERLARTVGAALDLEQVLSLAGAAERLDWPKPSFYPALSLFKAVPVAVARDSAFHFYYPDALDYLQACGAKLLPFSPLTASHLPEGAAGLILGGGFPEKFLPQLAANKALQQEIKRKADCGLPVYAEGGGLMYLCRSIKDRYGTDWPMTDLVPAASVMQDKRVGLGYRLATTQRAGILGPAGLTVKGHVFHYSRLEVEQGHPWAYHWAEGGPGGGCDGYASGSVWASYLHLHWAGNPAIAHNFLIRCRAYAEQLQK